MNTAFIILLMIFCHIVDDYYLQVGCLSSLKQKSWWEENVSAKLYKHDYLWALLMHSFSWAFMIMLPIAFTMNFQIDSAFCIVFMFNIIIHALVDNEKANRFTINLWVDQLIHLWQIGCTALFLL